ncbi:hypothetical protein ABNQ39_31130 [Azospirillum sp. A26]|uniref:hypothetical protein n=1 Tax=Azospirillum sp. A26 TaxID=3160607 RepID=UPI00366C0A04
MRGSYIALEEWNRRPCFRVKLGHPLRRIDRVKLALRLLGIIAGAAALWVLQAP